MSQKQKSNKDTKKKPVMAAKEKKVAKKGKHEIKAILGNAAT
ncbi:MAG: hypothetical protein Q9M23_03300 [Mariprofundaceae bacterium]|nr:hypothetical protein [Mariprofundaceae bacterium]